MARYLHACAFSPAISTFQKAINKGFFITWPGIDTLNFKKILETTVESEKGHLDQERKNLQSTKALNMIQNDIDNDFFPTPTDTKHNEFYSQIFHTTSTNMAQAYSDLTGRFPHKSSRGNQYLLVVYDYDQNAIVFEPLKTRQAKEITTAFNKCYSRLNKHDNLPTLFVLDNECSTDLKLSTIKHNNKYDLVPPNQHR